MIHTSISIFILLKYIRVFGSTTQRDQVVPFVNNKTLVQHLYFLIVETLHQLYQSNTNTQVLQKCLIRPLVLRSRYELWDSSRREGGWGAKGTWLKKLLLLFLSSIVSISYSQGTVNPLRIWRIPMIVINKCNYNVNCKDKDKQLIENHNLTRQYRGISAPPHRQSLLWVTLSSIFKPLRNYLE